MTWSVLGSFAITSLILAAAPGPDNIFVLTQSALHGVKKGIMVIIGLCLGIILQTLCMIVGITAFITAVPVIMVLLKVAGALYLCYLAYMAITHAKTTAHIDLSAQPQQDVPKWKLVRRGFIMNITNPKVQLFFLSFFPQFLPQGIHGWTLMGYMALLGCIFALATVLIFCLVALFSGSLASQFKSVKFNMCLNYSAAVIFISLALYTISTAF